MEADPYPLSSSVLVTDSITIGVFTPGVIIGMLVMVLLLLLSGLISGSEVAFFSLGPAQKEKLAETSSRINKMALRLISVPDRLLATILVANNFVNIAIVVLSTFITSSLFTFGGSALAAILIQIVLVTLLILFISEIFPKIYADRFAIPFTRFTAPVLTFLEKLFWPITSFLIYSTSTIQRRLVKHAGNISIDDLSNALELTESHFTDEKDILKGIIKFGNIDVCDIMRSRVDTVSVDVTTSFVELIKVINDSGYSRIPIYEETFDTIKGILYVKDLLPHLNKTSKFKWQTLIRPGYFVPESKKINDLLKEFQSNRIHMAIVVDEYGGSSGIVTLEDILEEIVGEITDESDEEKLPYEKIDSNTYLFEGKIPLIDFYKIYEIDASVFEEVKGEADTLAGLLLEFAGAIPKRQQKFEHENFTFIVSSVDNRRIKKIKVITK